MADGKIVVKTELDAKDAQKKLDALTSKIEKMEANLQKSTGEQSGIKAQLDAAKESAKQTETAIKALTDEQERLQKIMSGGAAASPTEYIEAYTKQAEVAAQLKEQEALLRQQDNAVESLSGKYAKITDKVIEQTSALNAAKENAGEYAEKITHACGASERMEAAAKSVSDSMNKFSKKIGGLFKQAIVFSLITKALQSLKTWLGKTIMQNEEARAAFARLKGALLTLAQPILNVVIPALVSLANILTSVITTIARFVSKLFGTTLEKSAEQAKALYDEQKAIEGVGGAAEKAGKQLAGFDEINQLLKDNAASGGGGAADTGIAPNFDFANTSSALDGILDKVKSIGAIIAGWALSTALLNGLEMLTGLSIPKNVKIGIALMVAGIALAADNIANIKAGKYKAASLNSLIREIISGMMIGVGASLISGGAVSALWAVPVAIALTIAVTEIIVNWDRIKAMWQDVIDGFAALLSGDEDTFWRKMTDAIAKWMGGDSFAVELAKKILGDETWEAAKKYIENGGTLDKAIETVAQNAWNKLTEPFTKASEWFDENVVQPINRVWDGFKQTWNAVVDSNKNVWGAFIDWMKGKNPEIAAMFQTIGDRFSGLFESSKKTLKGIIDFISGVFSWDWKKAWSGIQDVFSGSWNSMIATVEGAINFIIAGINLLISALNKIQINVPDWVPGIGGKSVGINIPPVKNVSLPRLATGAVIPPNREFMAVLGDQKSGNNIEAPEDLIRKIVREESGGSGKLEALLQTLIDVTREGKTLELDGVAFAKVAKRSLNNNSRAYGVPVRG